MGCTSAVLPADLFLSVTLHLILAKRPRSDTRQASEQVSSCKYLGMVFHQLGSWTVYIDYAKHNFKKFIFGILRLYRKRRGCLVSPVPEILKMKLPPQLWYGIWFFWKFPVFRSCSKQISLPSVGCSWLNIFSYGQSRITSVLNNYFGL